MDFVCPSTRCRGLVVPLEHSVKHLDKYHKGEELRIRCPQHISEDLTIAGFRSHFMRKHKVMKKRLYSVGSSFALQTSEHSRELPESPECSRELLYSERTDDVSSPSLCEMDVSDAESQECENISSSEEELELEESVESEKEVVLLSGDEMELDSHIVYGNSETITDKGEVICATVQDERIQDGAKFILSLHAMGLNNSQVMSVMKETETLVESTFNNTILNMKDANCDLSNVGNLNKLRKEACDVFHGLKTIHKQEKYLIDKLGVVKAVSVQVGSRLKRCGEGSQRKTRIVGEEFYYVPLPAVLEKLTNHPDFENITRREVDSDPDVLDCYLKGKRAQNNPILQEHPDALRLILYFDEVECCTALSSRASAKQKIGAFYMTLDNINPKFRGNLEVILLVAVIQCDLIKKHGIDIVLERIMKDLVSLETGLIINSKMMYATLIAFTGDNLGSHSIGGFKCGFTAHKMCRTCTATPEVYKTQVQEDPALLRTVEEYERQVKDIEAAKTLKVQDERRTRYGINRRCLLNLLRSFHAIYGLPPDLMHDLLEGCLLRAVKLIIKYCVENLKIFTLSWLNSAISDFDYGYMEKSSKPSPIKSDHLKEEGNLRQSSAQLWNLATLLPLIIGKELNEEDEYWHVFLTLLEICRMVFSSSIKKSSLPYLSSLISSYLSGYQKLYGHLLPKDHFLVHYPSKLLEMGTLVDFMCMRMEAFHQSFKKMVYVLHNYLNVPKSLSIRSQMKQAIDWSKPLVKPPVFGVLKQKDLQEVPYGSYIEGTSKVVEASWIQAGNFLIKNECYLCVGNDKDSDPVFVKVVAIIVWPSILLACSAVTTQYYDSHLSAYCIEDGHALVFCEIPNIKGRRIYHSHTVDQLKYIVMKECIGKSL